MDVLFHSIRGHTQLVFVCVLFMYPFLTWIVLHLGCYSCGFVCVWVVLHVCVLHVVLVGCVLVHSVCCHTVGLHVYCCSCGVLFMRAFFMWIVLQVCYYSCVCSSCGSCSCGCFELNFGSFRT